METLLLREHFPVAPCDKPSNRPLMKSAQKTVTREELHRLVWSSPMVQLAERFGCSDVALAKLCKRMDVPRPGRGYWAQLAAGQCPTKTPLPRSRCHTLLTSI